MPTIQNAAPQYILNGIQDLSGRPPVIDPAQVPSHLPHIFLFTERGPLEPQLVVGGSRATMYGSESFNLRSPYATHQTVLANVINEQANQVMLQRVVPSDIADEATLTLSLELVEQEIPLYERGPDGGYLLDGSGDRIVDAAGPINGYQARWVVTDIASSGDDFGARGTSTGSLIGTGSAQSIIYPIMDIKVSHKGSYGNRQGIRLSAPLASDTDATDEDVIYTENTFIFRAQLVELPKNSSSPIVIQTLLGEQAVDFSFKPDVLNTKFDSDLDIRNVLLQSYQDLEPSDVPKTFGPFGDLHVYDDNVSTILGLLFEAEKDQGTIPYDADDTETDYRYLFNFFTNKNHEGVPYYTLDLLGPADGGITLSADHTHYAAGGDDGTLSGSEFDTTVGNIVDFYDQQPWPMLDDAVYPQSCIYDSGFTLETKYKLLKPIALRKDMWVVLSTQDANAPQLSASEESSVAIALRAAARAYPESEVYGTATCRALVIAQSGYLINSQWKGLLPLTIELAEKSARYMGASNGIWKDGLGFDVPGNNHVRMFKEVNNAFKPARARNRDWDNGMVWAQNYDRRSLFFPAVQTVYNDDTSVLNAALTMMCAVELEKVCARVWRDLTGISYLTDGQFIERSDTLITEAVNGRFDGRFVIVPLTTITGNDEQRGYSWTTEITLYAPNMKTVGSYTITARRISDLDAA